MRPPVTEPAETMEEAAFVREQPLEGARSPIQVPGAKRERTFLVVADHAVEMESALRFASGRARKTGGRVAIIAVIAPTGFAHWAGVERLIDEEAREASEQYVQGLAAKALEWSGKTPILHIREGEVADQVVTLLEEDPTISILVLGAAIAKDSPGPLVTRFTNKLVNRLRVPVTIVPGALSNENIDALI